MGLMGSVGPAYLCPAAPVLRGGAALGMAGGDVSAVWRHRLVWRLRGVGRAGLDLSGHTKPRTPDLAGPSYRQV